MIKGYTCRVKHSSDFYFLKGVADIPRCENASCVALVVASQAVGISKLYNIAKSELVSTMIRVLESLGIGVRCDEQSILVEGAGPGGFTRPKSGIYVGKSSLISCCVLSILSTHPYTSFVIGESITDDDEINGRISASKDILETMEIFARIGAKFSRGDIFPIMISGTNDVPPIVLKDNISSEVVKTAVLLACTNIAGQNSICAQAILPSYTEWFLKYFGADISSESQCGSDLISVRGHKELSARNLQVFPSVSHVLYVAATAMILRRSSVEIYGAFLDKTARSVLNIFIEMGGSLLLSTDGDSLNNISIESSELMGINIECYDLRTILPELPIVCVVCAYSEGVTRIYGLSELYGYHKRMFHIVIDGLKQCGVELRITDDVLEIVGKGGSITEGAMIDSLGDYRIAIPFLILGYATNTSMVIKRTVAHELEYFIKTLNNMRGGGSFSVEFI